MTEKELKRMNRQELLNELYGYAKENAQLNLMLDNKEEELRQQLKKQEEMFATEQQKIQALKEQLRQANEKNAALSERLRKRSVVIEDAGNIADATCKLTGIFEEAQKTADLYVQNVREMTARQTQVLKEMEEKSRRDIQEMGDQASSTCIAMRTQTEKDCASMREKAERECANMRAQTEKDCASMRAQTEKTSKSMREKTEADCFAMKKDAFDQAEAYWADLTVRLENFYNAHQGMRELFGPDVIRFSGFRNPKTENES